MAFMSQPWRSPSPGGPRPGRSRAMIVENGVGGAPPHSGHHARRSPWRPGRGGGSCGGPRTVRTAPTHPSVSDHHNSGAVWSGQTVSCRTSDLKNRHCGRAPARTPKALPGRPGRPPGRGVVLSHTVELLRGRPKLSEVVQVGAAGSVSLGLDRCDLGSARPTLMRVVVSSQPFDLLRGGHTVCEVGETRRSHRTRSPGAVTAAVVHMAPRLSTGRDVSLLRLLRVENARCLGRCEAA